MADTDRNKGGGKSVAAAGIIALILMLGGGGYFGLGAGKGQDAGTGGGTETAQQEEAKEPSAEALPEPQEEAEEQAEKVPDVIVVTIKEDKVTINGHDVADQSELRQYVEEYNSDARTFTREEEQSMLETYNWVKAVFDDLDLQLKNAK